MCFNMTHPPTNSEGFWDYLFTETWEARQGREQTRFFAKVAVDHFPDWFQEEITTNAYSICDVGCALGDAVDVLVNTFPQSTIHGIDFSKEAITKAKKFYPDYSFEVADMHDLTTQYDVIFSSNTLEHFHDPFPIMQKCMEQAKKYLVLLLPFQDDTGTYEHFFRFDYEHFPETMDDGRLTFLNEIDCSQIAGTHWNAKQILAIYHKR